ncbi:MAG: Gfo/Idh/MocA family oxidoreductase [Treponema sp.]|jgi:predicted dehydrogenase|nr:Gfo/Idh/MocA family oxidoreductase [Treponema sp.]
MESLKIGIVGAGGMASYHYDGFIKAGAEVVAMADKDIARARDFGDRRGISRFYSSLEEMLDGSPEMEAVSIITPNKFHKPLVIEALERGKHVYCEKPPALNAAETEAMCAAAERSGKVLMFDLNNRAKPEAKAIMHYVQNGKVGKINSAQATWIRRNGIPGFGSWFTNKAVAGGGPMLDLPHMFDLALYFMGYPEPDYVLGAVYQDFMGNPAFKGPWGIPDMSGGITDVESSCHAFITFKTGQSLMVRTSWAEMNEREVVSVTFQGQKSGGKIERLFDIDGLDGTSIDNCAIFTEEDGRQVDYIIKAEKDEQMGRVTQASNFVEAVTGRAAPLNTPAQAVILMKLVDAIYESAAAGKPVKL